MRNIYDIEIDGVKLSKILEEHAKYLNRKGGKQADLRYADLSRANLSYADLSDANLRYANLSCADLSYANLSDANLRYADLSDANLRYANLRYADLSCADLRYADLSDANLRYADLSCANLSDANLRYADLSDANLSDANLRYADLSCADLTDADLTDANYGNIQCPEKGSFVAFKKLRCGLIAELEITKDALRSSATSRKCRASKVKVLAIYNKEKEVETGISKNDKNFIYRTGETIEIKNFDTNRWRECTTGIHFFITREEAENY